MKSKVVLTILMAALFMACGSDPGQASSGAAPSTSADTTTTTDTSCIDTVPDTEFLIPCPESVSGFPEVLAKSGSNVYEVTQTGSGSSYTLLSVGPHSSDDGRSCSFTINSDGSIQ